MEGNSATSTSVQTPHPPTERLAMSGEIFVCQN